MIRPDNIQPGDKIRIISPAGKVHADHILPTVHWLKQQGYRLEIGKHVFDSYHRFAGSDADRLHDLQEAIDDPQCKAILCARGGYGTIRIIDQVDFSGMLSAPKWLVGFSDITVLHSRLHNLNVASIHGAMPRSFLDDNGNPTDNLNSLLALLQGETIHYELDSHPLNKPGETRAPLVGGNLSILTSLMGTLYFPDTDGKILLIEDVDEHLYHLDRMMHQLKLGDKLERLAGLIVGDFSAMKDNAEPFGKTTQEIIAEAVEDYSFPVYFGFPAGHAPLNLALKLGTRYHLEIHQTGGTLHSLE